MTYLYEQTVAHALSVVNDEVERQEKLKAEGRFTYVAGDYGLTNAERFVMLSEEVGEVAREVFTQPDMGLATDTAGTPEGLEKELAQVAAIAVSWLAGLQLRKMVNL